MEIVRPEKDSGLGIYAKSVTVNPLKYQEKARNMVTWFNTNNGTFKGTFSKGFAIAHCQVENIESPLKLFVVDEDLVAKKVPETKKQNMVNCFFEAQAIWNAEILETPSHLMKMVPKRKVSKPEKGQVEVEIVQEETKVNNLISVPEACMSFPLRKEKNKDRYHTIKVRYQYIDKNILGMTVVKTFKGYVEGLKAHILQHECEHFEGKNMYFDH